MLKDAWLFWVICGALIVAGMFFWIDACNRPTRKEQLDRIEASLVRVEQQVRWIKERLNTTWCQEPK